MELPQQPPARRRLTQYIEGRAADLRMTLNEVAESAGLTKEGLRGVRNGSGRLQRLTKAGIEDALGWRRGSVDAILDGGEPEVIGPSVRIYGAELRLPAPPDPAAERRRIAQQVAQEMAADLQSGLEEAIMQALEQVERHKGEKEDENESG